mmetsp:Transcript_40004/g.127274  ORF Transcript_40004/g.127274 Transcript_40004/m.127274 type:complete len:260 (+) Transcript_40004:579-1358(+)
MFSRWHLMASTSSCRSSPRRQLRSSVSRSSCSCRWPSSVRCCCCCNDARSSATSCWLLRPCWQLSSSMLLMSCCAFREVSSSLSARPPAASEAACSPSSRSARARTSCAGARAPSSPSSAFRAVETDSRVAAATLCEESCSCARPTSRSSSKVSCSAERCMASLNCCSVPCTSGMGGQEATSTASSVRRPEMPSKDVAVALADASCRCSRLSSRASAATSLCSSAACCAAPDSEASASFAARCRSSACSLSMPRLLSDR